MAYLYTCRTPRPHVNLACITMSGWAKLSKKYCYIRCNNLPQPWGRLLQCFSLLIMSYLKMLTRDSKLSLILIRIRGIHLVTWNFGRTYECCSFRLHDQWRTQDFFQGGVLTLHAGRDAALALKRVIFQGWGVWTPLSNTCFSLKGGVWTPQTPPPPPQNPVSPKFKIHVFVKISVYKHVLHDTLFSFMKGIKPQPSGQVTSVVKLIPLNKSVKIWQNQARNKEVTAFRNGEHYRRAIFIYHGSCGQLSIHFVHRHGHVIF